MRPAFRGVPVALDEVPGELDLPVQLVAGLDFRRQLGQQDSSRLFAASTVYSHAS